MAGLSNYLGGLSSGSFQSQQLQNQASQQMAQQNAVYAAQMNQHAAYNQTGAPLWTTGTTTTATNFSIYNNVTSGSIGAYTSPDHYGYTRDQIVAMARQMAEQILEEKLQQERQLLLQWQRHAILPKLNFIRETRGPIAMPISEMMTVEGYTLPGGKTYVLPDGSKLAVDDIGNYGIYDEEAKVIYKANRVREFNPFLNASDQLEKFVREVGQIDGVNQSEVLQLPINAFIHWLVLQAATRDGDPTEHLPTVKSALLYPKTRLALPKPHKIEQEYLPAEDCMLIREHHYIERRVPMRELAAA